MYPLFPYLRYIHRRIGKWPYLRDECIHNIRGGWEGGHEAPPLQRGDVRHQDMGNEIDAGVTDCVQ